MLFWLEMGPETKARAGVYYAFEANFFAERATGVGERTHAYVVKPGGKEVLLDEEKTVEKILVPLCWQLEPREIHIRQMKALNAISELDGFDPLEPPKK